MVFWSPRSFCTNAARFFDPLPIYNYGMVCSSRSQSQKQHGFWSPPHLQNIAHFVHPFPNKSSFVRPLMYLQIQYSLFIPSHLQIWHSFLVDLLIPPINKNSMAFCSPVFWSPRSFCTNAARFFDPHSQLRFIPFPITKAAFFSSSHVVQIQYNLFIHSHLQIWYDLFIVFCFPMYKCGFLLLYKSGTIV